MEAYYEYVGFLAAFLTTISTLPQFIATVKTKNVEGVSLGMFLTLGSGIILWFIYGVLRNDIPLILANFATFILVSANIYMILKYRKDIAVEVYSDKNSEGS